LVLIAQAVFILEHDKQNNKQKQLNVVPHAGGYTAGVCNNSSSSSINDNNK